MVKLLCVMAITEVNVITCGDAPIILKRMRSPLLAEATAFLKLPAPVFAVLVTVYVAAILVRL